MNDEEKTRKNYEEGVDWHIEKSLHYNIASQRDLFVKNLKGNKILEIGIGAGRDIKDFLAKGLEIDGIDYSNKFIIYCKKLFPKVKYYHADVRTIKLEESAYDGIWAFASLLNLPKNKIKPVLQKLHKALMKEGIIFISVKEGEGEHMVPDKAGERLFSFYREGELKKQVQDAGFTVKYTEIVSDYHMTNREADPPKPNWVFLLASKN